MRVDSTASGVLCSVGTKSSPDTSSTIDVTVGRNGNRDAANNRSDLSSETMATKQQSGKRKLQETETISDGLKSSGAPVSITTPSRSSSVVSDNQSLYNDSPHKCLRELDYQQREKKLKLEQIWADLRAREDRLRIKRLSFENELAQKEAEVSLSNIFVFLSLFLNIRSTDLLPERKTRCRIG